MPVETHPRHVCLALPLDIPFVARALRGIIDYASARGEWTFSLRPTVAGPFYETIGMPLKSLRDWPVDGLIAALTTQREMDEVKRLGIPAVNLAGTLRDSEIPRVTVDNRAVGRLAAEHLIECGLRDFAYLGLKNIWYSELRRDGFAEPIAEVGGSLRVYETPRYRDPNKAWRMGLEQIGRCLERIRPPTGVLVVNDYRARLLVDECHRRQLTVPDQVAIIGIDNDDVVCEFCRPPMSSISRSGYQVGYQTAILLDRLMNGDAPPDEDVLIPPDGVIKRRSTDLIAVAHPQVAAAMEYIRGHLNEWFGVERLVQVLSISRRQLELLFKKHLNQTPYDYLRRARIDRAKTLLSAPRKMRVAEIARLCGFPNTHRFLMVFRDLVGKTPTNYRRDLRGLE